MGERQQAALGNRLRRVDVNQGELGVGRGAEAGGHRGDAVQGCLQIVGSIGHGIVHSCQLSSTFHLTAHD